MISAIAADGTRPEPTISGPDLVCLILGVPATPWPESAGWVGRLDAKRWGRFLPPHLRQPGSGRCSYRKITEREAAVVWACVEFAGLAFDKGSGSHPTRALTSAAADIGAHLHAADRLPAYAVWTARQRYLFTDDPAEVVRVCTEHGGGRVLRLGYYLARVRRFSKSSGEGAGVTLPAPASSPVPA